MIRDLEGNVQCANAEKFKQRIAGRRIMSEQVGSLR
jgi:hypothetical protein